MLTLFVKFPKTISIAKSLCSHRTGTQICVSTWDYDKYLPTIGILRPMPKALGDTLKIGGVW